MSLWLTSLWLEFLYFTGCAGIAELLGGTRGVILRFQRVRQPRAGGFQPLQMNEITPGVLDRLLRALRRWRYEIIPISQLGERLQQPSTTGSRRFVCLTFDIGYRDFLDNAWTIIKKHDVPVTLFVPASFPDQLGELWWLALEAVVASQPRIGLVVDGVEHRLGCRSPEEKAEAWEFLYATLRAMAPAVCSNTIRDLCRRYGVDLRALSSSAVLDWQQIATIMSDPLLTIGSSTVSYPVLAKADRQLAERELRMGRAVIETAIGRPAPHLAYPFGDPAAVSRREILLAAEIGFATAVTSEPGVLRAENASDLLSLPRISWDGRRNSLRAIRAMLAGLGLPRPSTPQNAAATPTASPST